jgi:hypothetical protein
MKREQLGWIVACLLIVVVAAGAMQQQAVGVGRFQIVSGVVPLEIHGVGRRYTALSVLLNTETGEARPLIDGKQGLGWNPPIEIEGQEWK